MKIFAAAIFALALAGCGGDQGTPDGSDLGAGADDLSVARDLALPVDAVCVHQLFTGFAGTSPTERRLDCACGCTIDKMTGGFVAGFWGVPTTPGASLTPTDAGFQFFLAPPDGGVAIATVNSQAPVAPFYLDGDYDLFVDYALQGALPAGGHAILNVQDVTPTGHFTVERENISGTGDVYGATLGGIPQVTMVTAATSGTLELKRVGAAVHAIADGTEVSQFTGASTGRVLLAITGALADCGPGCTATVVFSNARMTAGALVDRR